MKKVLVVDDKISTLKVISEILEDEGYKVTVATNAKEAYSVFEQERDIDAVLADLRMPGMNGLELFRKISVIDNKLPFIIMTAYGTIESAVQAMKEGVTNYLVKPLNFEELVVVLDKAIKEREIVLELDSLKEKITEKYAYQNMIGVSQKMKEIFKILESVAPTDAPVLIYGETGTGKELLARAIHSLSSRNDQKMVCINSAALSETLLEAELFGYVKGAFTGALRDKKGRFELADGGTLFLDEIGHMSLNLQTKLLRFLEDGTIEPVGSVENKVVDVRIIAATNKNLEKQIELGRFISDLFYRIHVLSISLPPLRERREDIPLLANHFIRRYSAQYKKSVHGIARKAMETLIHYSWPGNIRELENCIARAIILCKGTAIQSEDLPEKIKAGQQEFTNKEDEFVIRLPKAGVKLRQIEREIIKQTLDQCGGNKTMAAKQLGISRKALYEKIDRYNIRKL